MMVPITTLVEFSFELVVVEVVVVHLLLRKMRLLRPMTLKMDQDCRIGYHVNFRSVTRAIAN